MHKREYPALISSKYFRNKKKKTVSASSLDIFKESSTSKRHNILSKAFPQSLYGAPSL